MSGIAIMKTLQLNEISGLSSDSLTELLTNGPICLEQNNGTPFVLLSKQDYEVMISDLREYQIESSMADLKAGRINTGTAAQLIQELTGGA